MPVLACRNDADGFAFVNSWTLDPIETAGIAVIPSHPIFICRSLLIGACLFWFQITASAQPMQDAVSLQKQAIERVERCAANLRKKGELQSVMPEVRQAVEDLSRSYQEFMNRENWTAAALSLHKLAVLQRWQHQWQPAKDLYQQAYDLARRANHVGHQVKMLVGLAKVACLGLKDYEAAISYLDEATRLGESGVDKRDLFDIYDLKSLAYGYRNDLAVAFNAASRALSLALEMNDPESLYYGYFSRGSIYQTIGFGCDDKRGASLCVESLDRARTDYEEALRIAQKAGYDFLGQTAKASLEANEERRNLFSFSESVAQKINLPKLFTPAKPSDVLVNETFLPQPAMPPALENYLQGWTDLFKDEAGGSFHRAVLFYSRGQVEEALRNFLKAAAQLEADRRKLSDESGRSAFVEDKMRFFYHPILLLLELRRYPEAFELLERSRSRALADLLQTQELKFAEPADRALYSESVKLNAHVSRLQKELFDLRGGASERNASRIAEKEQEIRRLEGASQKLTGDILRSGSKLRELTDSRPVSLADLQRVMREENFETLIYLSESSGVVLWHISGEAVHVRSIFLPQKHLVNKIAALQRSLKDNKASFDEKTARELFLYLIQPALQWIKSDRLIIIPHDDLHYIPFQVLTDPATGRALGERFAISYAPSATVLLRLKKSESLGSGRLLAAARSSLAGEVKAISNLYPGRSRMHERLVTKDELKRAVSGYDLIHLSVHGNFFGEEPLLSYLELQPGENDDGRLTAAEMFGLQLQNARLVVLSACETGQAEATRANEVIGMTRALLYAGANSLVLSSWRVDIQATALWMETFYREAQTRTPAEAARAALMTVKKHPGYSHPYYWSAFLLIGR
jgi:CHAT domain-containing protein